MKRWTPTNIVDAGYPSSVRTNIVTNYIAEESGLSDTVEDIVQEKSKIMKQKRWTKKDWLSKIASKKKRKQKKKELY